ncbi:hypothetical protein [Blastococcus atacamensis]|uniref:hypothetical protein n=1 Tax=Blastococcus atacamensis TaxID=2070508 RepID=UPI001E403EFB|nr:hypothetical protein [Blastococcus atacamensis]
MSERDREPATTEMSYASPIGGAPPTGGATAPSWSTEPVVFRRPDPVAGLLLLLAGVAAGASLLLRWLADDDATGLDLVRRGFSGLTDVADTGLWQPLAIVLGGVALFVLGMLMFLPARAHRLWGLLALLVSALVVWAVLVPLIAADVDLGFFDTGFWCAIAVAVLGLLGAGKALLTRPRTD